MDKLWITLHWIQYYYIIYIYTCIVCQTSKFEHEYEIRRLEYLLRDEYFQTLFQYQSKSITTSIRVWKKKDIFIIHVLKENNKIKIVELILNPVNKHNLTNPYHEYTSNISWFEM